MTDQRPRPEPRAFESRFRVRSYELDSFGHLNHAVYLNYFEQARFDALAEGGFPLSQLAARGWGVHVVRVEVDYRREALLGQQMLVRTHLAEARSSSMTLAQVALDPARPDHVFAESRVVAVWIGPDRGPMRIPSAVREALGVGT
jgi:YbgC/YbaW family acyl-CoA thioester hydrolase